MQIDDDSEILKLIPSSSNIRQKNSKSIKIKPKENQYQEAICVKGNLMTKNNRFVSLTEHQIEAQETLTENLCRAKALIEVALGEGFLDYENVIINDYLWVVWDLIDKGISLNEKILSDIV